MDATSNYLTWFGLATFSVLWGVFVKWGGKWLLKIASQSTNKYMHWLYRDALIKGLKNDLVNSDSMLLTFAPVVAMLAFTSQMLSGTLDLRDIRGDVSKSLALIQLGLAVQDGIELNAEQKKLLADVKEEKREKSFAEQLPETTAEYKDAIWSYRIALAMLAFFAIFTLYLTFYWGLKRTMTAAISANLARSMSRLEGIASEDEYRKLCLLDLQAVDDATVDTFFDYLAHLADKYQFPFRVNP